MKLKRKPERTTQIVLWSVFLLFSCSFVVHNTSSSASVSISVEHIVGERILKLDSSFYKNALGQSFTISKFKYYLGEIVLKQENGKAFQSHDYFLVDEEDALTKQIVFKQVPPGDYTSLEFIIGVDSLHNCSGAQSGALDPVNGMFWAWNSGYIFLKLEGASPASRSPGHIFEYHIGGYKQPANCIRKIRLPITLSVKEHEARLFLRADISRIIDGPENLNFEQLSSVTDFHNAGRVADNYANMFSIRTGHEN